MEQLKPMPNGYGMVKLPHFRGQPGLVVLVAVSMVAGVMEVVVVVPMMEVPNEEKMSKRSHNLILCMKNMFWKIIFSAIRQNYLTLSIFICVGVFISTYIGVMNLEKSEFFWIFDHYGWWKSGMLSS